MARADRPAASSAAALFDVSPSISACFPILIN